MEFKCHGSEKPFYGNVLLHIYSVPNGLQQDECIHNMQWIWFSYHHFLNCGQIQVYSDVGI